MPTIKQLMHASQLARHRNFRDAAAAAKITQPALSRSIQALEQDLGVSLFDRHAGRIEPTNFGAIVLRHTRSILESTDDLKNEIDRARGLESGHFSVSAGALPAGMHASLAVARVMRARPGLTCKLRQESWRDVIARVLAREIDVGVAETSHAEHEDQLQTELVAAPRFVFYCRAGHPLQALSDPSLGEIFNYPVAATRGPHRIAAALDGIDARGGAIDPVSGDFLPAIEVESMDTAKRIIANSDAVGAAPLAQIEDELNVQRFRVIDFHRDWMRLNYGFIFLRNRTLPPAANLFMQEFRSVASQVSADEHATWVRLGLPI